MAAKNLKIRPLDDRVVVEPVEAEERTASDIEVDGHEVKILRESDILAKVLS